ncbi:MAG TPA: hypothetical protein VE545_09070 [Candidatus Dormibacteraeota bacterium]|nr:hypothetical protein [Candidatus Dormibacteraeota bacterium]
MITKPLHLDVNEKNQMRGNAGVALLYRPGNSVFAAQFGASEI